MHYLLKEIARLEKLVEEKTARVQPSESSLAAAGRRSILRILTAGTAYSSAATTPSSADERQEARNLGRRSSSIREGASGAPQTDAPGRSSGRSDTTARTLETRS